MFGTALRVGRLLLHKSGVSGVLSMQVVKMVIF